MLNGNWVWFSPATPSFPPLPHLTAGNHEGPHHSAPPPSPLRTFVGVFVHLTLMGHNTCARHGFCGTEFYPLSLIGVYCAFFGPTYSARGRIRRLLAYCSRMWAVQPVTRLQAK